jgi:hypothetical protein
VTFKQTYLTGIGFDFSNFAIANFAPVTNTFTQYDDEPSADAAVHHLAAGY